MMIKKRNGEAVPRGTGDRIIDAAMELFADRGYEGCTVQDIADAVGIKAASLYAHYQGKEAIFDATLDAAVGRWKALVDAAFAAAEGVEGLEEGAALILAGFMETMAGSTSYRFWTRVYVFPPAHLTAKRMLGLIQLDRAFASRLREACARRAGPEIKKRDLDGYAASLTHFMMGILVNSMGKVPPEGEIRTGVSLLTRGLLAEKGAKKER